MWGARFEWTRFGVVIAEDVIKHIVSKVIINFDVLINTFSGISEHLPISFRLVKIKTDWFSQVDMFYN